jgi:hypothetical protein
MSAEHRRYGRWRESLTRQELIRAGVLGGIGDLLLAAQFFLEGFLDQASFVDLAERFTQRFGCDVARDSHGLQFALHSEPAAPFDLEGAGGIRPRDASVVQFPGFEKMLDGSFDILGVVLAIEESRAKLRDRELAPCEQLQRILGGRRLVAATIQI